MQLTLPEKLLLLALHDTSGERHESYIDFALGGAAFAELILRGHIVPSASKEGRFQLGNDELTGDPFLDACFSILKDKGIEKDPRDLVAAIGKKQGVSQPLMDRLVQQGVLEMKTKKVFFFFNKTVYPEADPTHERSLKDHLATVMFSLSDVEPGDSVLIALAHNMNLLKVNFDKSLLKQYRDRIKEIAKGEHLVSHATAKAVEAVQAAIFVSVILPAVIIPAAVS